MNEAVVIGMPHNQTVHFDAAKAMLFAPSREHPVHVVDKGLSNLTGSFNSVWAAALDIRDRTGTRLFVMLHGDVCPEPYFVDKLVKLQREHDAVCVSTIIPLRNATGLTSTGQGTDDIWSPVRRLTLKEVYSMPPTFCRNDVFKRGILLVNTGCWIIDMMAKGVEDLVFRNQDRIVKSNGRRVAEFFPEDWQFSHDLHRRKLPYVATREVAVYHGHPDWHNRSGWGQETDTAYLKLI